MVCYFSYICINQQLQLYAIQQETKTVKEKLEQAVECKNNLLVEKEKLGTRNYVEKVAREELGLVKPGEVPFVTKESRQ